MRKTIAAVVLAACFTGIALLFWFCEWRYSLPTPVPEEYHAVAMGAEIAVDSKIQVQKDRPVFIHFFNPDCPCSRFNMPYFKKLSVEYGDKISFAVVLFTTNKSYTAAAVQKKYGLDVPVYSDTTIATICGVYSTPQAVLLTSGRQLYYRGNYNRSRYCTDAKTNYAEMAISAMLNNELNPSFDKYAITAYGCSLPGGCKK